LLGTVATIAEIVKQKAKSAAAVNKPAEQTSSHTANIPKEDTMAKVAKEIDKVAKKVAPPTKAPAKVAPPAKAKAPKAPKVAKPAEPEYTGPKFLDRPEGWWLVKAVRFAFYLLLTNLKNKLTDEQIYGRVLGAFPDNTAVSKPSSVAWYRGCVRGNFTSSPRPGYIPEGTPVPDRYWLVDGKLTQTKPASKSAAPKEPKAAKAPKGTAPAASKAAKRDAAQTAALANPPAPKKLPPPKAAKAPKGKAVNG
jgi:hypothetical protein